MFSKLRAGLAWVLVVMGYLFYIVFGLWAFIIELMIINYLFGFWGSLAAFILLPITYVFAPWYALIAWGNWSPLIIGYGGMLLATVFVGIGKAIHPEDI